MRETVEVQLSRQLQAAEARVRLLEDALAQVQTLIAPRETQLEQAQWIIMEVLPPVPEEEELMEAPNADDDI